MSQDRRTGADLLGMPSVSRTDAPPVSSLVDHVLRTRGVRTEFQPIVDLDTAAVVAYEALSRGPAGPLERPDALFDAARAARRLAEVDELCRHVALASAIEAGIFAPHTLFVNVEPEVLESGRLADLVTLAEGAPGRLQIVLEITERALAARPAELLDTVRRLRAAGWRVALDDVGADDMSLAFMPLLRPDIVKLDLRLVQKRPGPAVAEIMNAVNAYAERTGAVLLAEGIENEVHVEMARALGARLGQGWMFGRPAPLPAPHLPVGTLTLGPAAVTPLPASPFACLPADVPLRRSTKPLLIELSKFLEREAARLGSTCMVVAAFQEARHFTAPTATRYRELVERIGFVAAIGEGLGAEPVTGLRGSDLSPDDPVRGEWDIVVLAPHFAAALLARDLGDDGVDLERRFEFALTYDREVASTAAECLMSRVLAHPPAHEPATPAGPASPACAAVPAAPLDATVGGTLHRALAATTNGITIADVTRPDQPLIYVNTAFERLSGLRAEQILGRNCRFLQTPETDPAAITRIRDAIADGREVRETILNHRGPDRTPWWNEIYLAPVLDENGRPVQYIGIQNDVTARVKAEQALARERERSLAYLAELEGLAFRDPLTGLLNRRRMQDVLETSVLQARLDNTGVALLYLDIDRFKAINDDHGHLAGDAVLVATAQRLRGRLRRGDQIARIGGDEFLVVLLGLDPDAAPAEAAGVAEQCLAALREPVPGPAGPISATVSLGVSCFPQDGDDFDVLVHAADQRMYRVKQARRPPVRG